MKRTNSYGEVVEASYELGLKTYNGSGDSNSLETYDGIYCNSYNDARKKKNEYIKKIGQQVRTAMARNYREYLLTS